MGSYLNPGNEKFAQCVNSEIYVDKTEATSDMAAMKLGDRMLVMEQGLPW